jgi:hypothetical protein
MMDETKYYYDKKEKRKWIIQKFLDLWKFSEDEDYSNLY